MGETAKIILAFSSGAIINIGVLAVFRSILLGWFKARVDNEKELFTSRNDMAKLLIQHDEKIHFLRKEFDELKKEHKENHKWGG